MAQFQLGSQPMIEGERFGDYLKATAERAYNGQDISNVGDNLAYADAQHKEKMEEDYVT